MQIGFQGGQSVGGREFEVVLARLQSCQVRRERLQPRGEGMRMHPIVVQRRFRVGDGKTGVQLRVLRGGGMAQGLQHVDGERGMGRSSKRASGHGK